ncbi:hypothetical protein EUTSA_v10029415mg, partial [Eutrema salsugineum]
MNTPYPKRPCYDVTSSIQNPNSQSVAPDFNQSNFDSTISSLLLLPDSPSTSIGCSFDQALGRVISSASCDDSVQDRLIDHTRKLTSLLHESINRFSRKRATLYNSKSWPLPYELTIKVFSMLDTKALVQAAGCCSMFGNYSMDPLCYSHIDLSMDIKSFKDEIVFTMIRRAGKELRSLKLGSVASQVIPRLTRLVLPGQLSSQHIPLFTRSCLPRLRRLHFYRLDCTYTKLLEIVMSVCPNLTELKMVNIDKKPMLQQLSKSPNVNHDKVMRLYLSKLAVIGVSSFKALVTACPNLTSLTLLGFNLMEEAARDLALGFPKLNYMNLSGTPGISGQFLSDLGNSGRENRPLKTLILRNCPSLKNEYIMQLLISLITGDFRFLRHI